MTTTAPPVTPAAAEAEDASGWNPDPPARPGETGLGRRSARSAAVTLGGSWARLLVNLAGTVVLARLLRPDDFGLMAMAMTLMYYLGSLTDFGLSHAMVHAEALDARTAAGLFRLNRRLSLAMGLLVAACGPAVAWLYGRPVVAWLSLGVAGTVAVGSLLNPYVALLRRQFRFGVLTLGETGGLLLSTAAAVVAAAFLGFGVWALVIQFAGQYLGAGLLAWRASGWRPMRRRDFAPFSELTAIRGYARNVAAARLLGNVGRNTDTVLVGTLGGAGVLGLYQKSYQWSVLPVQQICQPLLNVAVSALSRLHRGEAERYRSALRRSLLVMFSVTVPLAAVLLLEARPIVLLLLGDQWLGAIPLFRLLCLASFAQGITAAMKWIFLSEGRTARQLQWAALSTPTMLLSVVAGAVLGASGGGENAVAWGTAAGFSAGSLLLVIPGAWFCTRGGRLRTADLLQPVWRPTAASALMTGLLLLVPDLGLPTSGLPVALRLAAAAALAGLVYGAFWLLLPGGRRALETGRETIRLVR